MAGNLDGARILLRRGGAPSLSISDAFGWTPAAWACAYGWTFLLEEMITVAGDQRLWDFEVTMCLKEFRIMGVNYKQVKALHIATIGSAETVAYLLDQGYATDLDITTSNGTTALHIAAILGQHDSISLLISRGANIDAQDQGGFTPLHASIYHSNDSTTALLLKMGAKHLKSKNGKTPLDIAIHRNTKAIMQMVQDSVLAAAATGKDVASQEKQMKATVFAGSMQYAIDRDDEEDVVKLLDAECSPNIIMSSCRTCSPLLYALGKNDVPEGCVSVLISRGASFKGMTCRRHGNSKRYNAVTWQGWQRGSKIEDGSGSSSSDSLSSPSEGSSSDDQAWPIRGSTTLDFFMDGGRPEKTLLTYLEAIPLTELVWLVNNSATAHRAIKRKSNDSLAALLSHLKRVESSLGRNLAKEVATQPEGESGNTPLHLAAFKKNVVAAKLLIAHGADPDAANSSGMTPLHLAADREGAAMVEALLNQGASIEVRDGRGRTALQAAVLKDNIHAIEALLARGTRIEVNDGGNRFIYLDKIKPFRMLLAAGMSINQPGALGLPVWSSALLKVEVATFLLNSDFARDIAVDPQTMSAMPPTILPAPGSYLLAKAGPV
uniref:Ankyrin epithelial n=1 Tax=Colletotrichum fructicola (strain Nara gc5) TaxID=1213859 RepID=L2FIF8_COLFN